MDLLNIFAGFILMSYVNGVQSSPEYVKPTIVPTPTETVEIVQTEVPTPSPTPEPTFTPGPTAIAKPNITANPNYKLLRMKNKGAEVVKLQEQLKKYGYYHGEIDGKYGGGTAQAVRIFQKLHGLTSDGEAGKETLTILYESDNIVKLPTYEDVQVLPISLDTPAPTFIPKK